MKTHHLRGGAFIKGDVVMANKNKTIDVTGLSINDIMDIDIDTFNKLGERDLRAITSRLVSASNKRIRAMEKRGIQSPAIRSLGSDGTFSTKLSPNISKSQRVNKLRSEFSRARNFLQMKTSTMKGYRSYEKQVRDEFRKSTGRTPSSSDIGRIFGILHRLQQSGVVAGRGTIGSEQARQMITDIMLDNPDLSDDEVMERVYNDYNEYYEEEPDTQFEFKEFD